MPSSSHAESRLSSISSHLTPTTAAMSSERPFITCHVLDTVAGKPGANISVTLRLVSPQSTSLHWTAKTNSDGRVAAWSSIADLNTVVQGAKEALKDDEQMVWSLTFDTESYFGKGKTFWPEVELRFAAKKEEEHYHVPLLLGPWSYTTYRGS